MNKQKSKKSIEVKKDTTLSKDNLFSNSQIVVIFILLVLTYFSFFPALDNEFVDWDDSIYVLENNLVLDENTTVSDVFKQAVSLNYHPLTILTMHWNANECKECLHGISAKPFIQWNILIHILNTFLVLLVTFKLSNNNFFVGVFSAGVFAIHPMHVESVVWISERKDVLYVFFFLLSLLTFLKFLETNSENKKVRLKWILLTFVLFVLSCLSKAMAVVLPIVLLLIDFFKNKEENPFQALKDTIQIKNLLKFIPFFAVSLFFGLMASSIQKGGDFGGLILNPENQAAINDFEIFSVFQRLQFASYGLCKYIINFFIPYDLSTFYPYPTQLEFDSSYKFVFCFVTSVFLFVLTILSFKKDKIYFFGIGFFFITIALVLQFISVGSVIMADRYSYLPYVGLSFMLASILHKHVHVKIRNIVYGILVLVMVFFISMTRKQVDVWQDSDTLWTKVIEQHPNEDQAYSIRGNYYGKRISYYMQLGDTINQNKFLKKAENDFKNAIRLKTNRLDVYEGMGNIYAMKNDPKNAIEMYSKAIEIQANNLNLHFNRAIAYSLVNDNVSFLSDMNTCVSLQQSAINFLYRGIAKQALGDKLGAISDFEAVLKLEKDNKIAKERLLFLKQ